MSTVNSIKTPVIVAIDKSSLEEVQSLADSLDPIKCRLKVGKQLFTRYGPMVIKELHQRGFEVFLDLKFHDIPNTTAQAVLAAADLGVWMVNVHASAGLDAMQLAKSYLRDGSYDTLLIAVTVLTSMTQDNLPQIGIDSDIDAQVKRLALLTQQAGLDGVVCSAQEANALKALCGQDFKLVTPGIRLATDSQDDQKRICTPAQAVANGADYLVIGRSITEDKEPNHKLEIILNSIG